MQSCYGPSRTPENHWPQFLAYVRHAVIDDYRNRKADYLARGMDEIEAMHAAADGAVNELKHKTRQRRRVERDVAEIAEMMGELMGASKRATERDWLRTAKNPAPTS